VAAARADGEERDDVAGLLLRSDLGKKAFRHNLRTFMLAGSDTTAGGLSWAMWELAVHPEIRQRVEQEADDVLGERIPREEDVAKLRMCRAVVDETLRLHPPIWTLARDANDADVVDGCPIKADERVVIPFFAMHRSPHYWRDPEAFDPRRFLEDPEQARRNDSYLPFGAGKHQCIGRDLALTIMVLSVAVLSRRFRVTPDGAEQVRQQAHTTLKAHSGMPVTIHERPHVQGFEPDALLTTALTR
jgi:cytochrome P450